MPVFFLYDLPDNEKSDFKEYVELIFSRTTLRTRVDFCYFHRRLDIYTTGKLIMTLRKRSDLSMKQSKSFWMTVKALPEIGRRLRNTNQINTELQSKQGVIISHTAKMNSFSRIEYKLFIHLYVASAVYVCLFWKGSCST